jgi:ribonuclease HI
MKDLYDAGLRGHLPVFISNFLSDRIFRVRIGSLFSDFFNQDMGVPQGSILSVTLFSLKINSIVKALSSDVHCSLYVDDFLICYSSPNMDVIERKLQLSLDKLQQWCEENGFKFSKTKTVCMHFCMMRKIHLDPVLNLGGDEIPVVEQTKFLGLIFDKKLSFIPHIKYVRDKCTKALNLLKVVSNTSWGADRTVLLRLYRSLVRSKLDYGSIVYGSARKSYLKKLDPIQNGGLRICLGAFRTSPVESLHVEANEMPLHLRRMRLSLLYAVQLRSNRQNPAYQCVFYPRFKYLYERRKTPILSFGLRIKDHLQKLDIDLKAIAQFTFPETPPWTFDTPDVKFDLGEMKKSETDSSVFKSKFGELRSSMGTVFEIYTDGSKQGEKVGGAIYCEHGCRLRRLPDRSSVYSAELEAILMAIEFIRKSRLESFAIFSDSKSALQAIDHLKWDNPSVLKILDQLEKAYVQGKHVTFVWLPSHTGIKGNERADIAAKAARNVIGSLSVVPHGDFRQRINEYLKSLWQTEWDTEGNNKLHAIHPVLGVWHSSVRKVRKDEVILARLRIGHTHSTHSYLLKDEPPPFCTGCQSKWTVEHFMMKCSAFMISVKSVFLI